MLGGPKDVFGTNGESQEYGMRGLTREKQEKLLAALLVAGLIAITIPLLVIGHYNFKSVDDYSYAIRSEPIWQQTHSLGKLFWSQILVSIDMWKNWQGIYFGDWMMTTALGLWGTRGYFMSAYLTIGGLILSQLFAASVILRRGLGASRAQTILGAVPCIMLQLLLIPSPAEGFYWMCGALLYTFVFALSMIFVGILTIYLLDNGKSLKKTVFLEALIVLFSFMLGGGTYPTGLGTLLILACMTAWCFYRKKKQRVAMACNTCLYLGFFLLNMLSPGASARQSAAGSGMGALPAVLSSLREAALYIKNWTALPILLVMLFMIPVFWRIAGRRRFTFRYPVVATALSFGIYAAHFTPCLYALEITGPYRVQNIYRFLLYIWLFGNELYWLGWLRARLERRHMQAEGSLGRPEKRTAILEKNAVMPKERPAIPEECAAMPEVSPELQEKHAAMPKGCPAVPDEHALGRGAAVWIDRLFLPCGIGAMALVGISLLWYAGDKLTPVSALLSLKRGEAAAYRAEYRERLNVLEDPSVKEVYLQPFSCKPYMLYFGDVETDPRHWANQAVAEYYGKDFVRLAE